MPTASAHAAAAYYGWGNFDDDVLVLTCDGAGDGLCATVSVGRAGKLERLASVPQVASLGNIYAMFTSKSVTVDALKKWKFAPTLDRGQQATLGGGPLPRLGAGHDVHILGETGQQPRSGAGVPFTGEVGQ